MARPLIKRFYHAYRRSTLVSVRAREQRTARALRRRAFFDEAYYADRYPEVSGSGLDAISHYCRWGDVAGYSPHPLFDPLHYSAQYPDLPASGGRRLLHFLGQGRTSLATPHPLFDSAFYVEEGGPLMLPDENALLHYVREGEELGYWPHPFFDPGHYEASNPDLWSVPCKLAHFATDGGQEGRSPCWLFDPAWYRVQCPESESAQRSPLTHYQQVGDEAGLSPHPLFDPAHYSLQYPDLPRREGQRLRHYMLQGAYDRSSPHPLFDGGWYQRQNANVLDAGMNPLRHYLESGQKEGLNPSPEFSSAAYFQKYPELDERRVNPLVDHVIREAKGAGLDGIATGTPSLSASAPEYSGDPSQNLPTLLAFYLPQFHPIPENDEWWGKGFTEWTNVTKALPSYPGHEQPQLPSELGFYDLRLPEVRKSQAALAKEYGIGGFCYYYYWFEGRKILERPLEEVVASGEPDFPFCICWANENWTRRWDGLEDDILLRQEHSLKSDYDFIQDVLPIFHDPRYIRVEGSPLLLVYRAEKIKDPEQTTALWRDAARQAGFPGLHLAAVQFKTDDPREYFFDSAVEFPPHHFPAPPSRAEKLMEDREFSGAVLDYVTGTEEILRRPPADYVRYRSVMPRWDNTARRGSAATIYHGASPSAYERWLLSVLNQAREQAGASSRFVFINAWNEWAEGAHLEPDQRHGRAFLEATRRALIHCAREPAANNGFRDKNSESPNAEIRSARIATPENAPEPILLIAHDAAAAGSQFVLLEFLRAMAGRGGYRAHLVLQDGGALVEKYKEVATTTLLDGQPQPGSQAEQILRETVRHLRSEGLRRAVCNTVVTSAAADICKQEGLSVLVLVHEQPASIDELFGGDATMAKINRSADEIVGVSQFSIDSLESRYGRLQPKLSVLHPPMREFPPPGLTRESARAKLISRLSEGHDCHLVLGCGTLYPRKGPDLFIHLARAVKLSRPDADFRFVWAGGALTANGVEAHQRSAEEAGVGDILEFVGAQNDIAPFFLAADSFALTSREDPFPLVNMEAMSFGLPVVAFAGAGGAPELIENDAGIVVPYLDVEAMAEAVIRLQDDPPLRQRLGNRARAKMSEAFSPEHYTDRLLDRLENMPVSIEDAADDVPAPPL